MEDDPRRRHENPLKQGARYGAVGCAGCSTFVVIGFLLLVLLLVWAGNR